MAWYSGRCLCGAVSYSTDVEPLFTGNCHCKDCQRASGGAFVPAMIFPEARVAVSGKAKYFKSTAESGNIHKRGFCPKCGSRMFAKFSAMPGMLGIAAGTLDNTSAYSPKLDFFVASAVAWNYLDPQLPKKQGAPNA
jgi:hypothetical protein